MTSEAQKISRRVWSCSLSEWLACLEFPRDHGRKRTNKELNLNSYLFPKLAVPGLPVNAHFSFVLILKSLRRLANEVTIQQDLWLHSRDERLTIGLQSCLSTEALVLGVKFSC